MSSLRRFAIALALLPSPLLVSACDKGPTPEELEEARKNKLADAKARLANNKLDDAAALYESVLQTHPDDPEAIGGLGKTRYHQGKSKEALELLTKAAKTDPDNAELHATIGELHAIEGRLDKSAAAWKKAWELSDENPDYGLAYGIVLNKAEKYAAAEPVLEEVAEIDPQVLSVDKTGVHTVLGDAQRGQGKLDDALRSYMKAQTTYQSDKMAFAGAAFVYEAKNDIKHALDQWSAYIIRDGTSEYSKTVAQKKVAELGELEKAGEDQDG